MNFCVYMHISPNNKRYIGLTSRKPEHRWNNGKGYKGNSYFTNAINKYGQYALCYNEGISKFFKLRYDLIKIFIPELIELGSYCDYIDNKYL